MLRRIISILLGAVLLTVLFGVERAWRPSHVAAYRIAVDSAATLVTAEEMRLFQHIVESIARLNGDSRLVQVNGSFGSDHINVALVPFQDTPKSLALPKEGFVSVPPNVLFVDLGVFRSILLQTFNDIVSFAQAMGEMERLSKEKVTEEDIDLAVMKYGALSLQLRLANFSDDSIAGKYAPMIASALMDSLANQDLYLAFVFPISHELYHLRRDARVGMNIMAEELAADSFSVAAASTALQKNDDSHPMRYQLLFIGVRFYQDRLLQGAFQGMRGLQAQSLLVGLTHASCKVAQEIPWPQRFNNPDVVVLGHPLAIPILSEKEVASVVSHLNTFNRRDHPHILHRLERLRKEITSELQFSSAEIGLELTEHLLKLYTQHVPSFELFDWAPTGSVGRKPVSDLVRRLNMTKERVTAKGCEDERCITAKVGPGYVDILADNSRVRALIIAQPMTDTNGVGALFAAVQEFSDQERATEIMLRINASLKECGVASSMVQLGDYLLSIRTMNEDDWLEARFVTER